jgi:S1-C subfamily serine protease
MRLYYLLTACFLISSCDDHSFVVSRVVDGNTIELKNGLSVDLSDVNEDPKNEAILATLLNKKIFLVDENDDRIEKFTSDRITAYIYTEEGEYINLLIKASAENDIQGPDKPLNVAPNNTITEPIATASTPESLQSLYKRLKPSVFLIYTSDDINIHQGTGFFIESSGIAVSNYHVFKGTIKGKEVIKTHEGKTYKVKEIIKKSAQFDYVVFSIEKELNQLFPHLIITSDNPEIGEDCFAIGHPRGLEHTLSKGLISQLREEGNIIQTTADITHGSSGGPLFNMKGEVIGITFAGMGEASLNFAINIKLIKD